MVDVDKALDDAGLRNDAVKEYVRQWAAHLTPDRIEVVSAESGAAGLALLNAQPELAAVLVDIMMPEMDGYEVIRRIRADARFRDLPLIAVTAKAMAEDRERCFNAGASDYLSKPVEKEELIAVLRTWVKRRKPRGSTPGTLA